MSALRDVPARTAGALGLVLAYGAGAWLVVLHHAEGGHEGSEPPLLLHVLRDGTLALPAVAAAAWLGAALALRLIDPDRALPARWRSALVATGAAAVAAVVLGAGNPLHGALFDAHEPQSLPAALHIGRDALVALAVGLPLALLAVLPRARPRLRRPAVGDRRRGQATALVEAPAPAPAGGPAVTRRGFVAGAGGLAAAGLAGSSLTRSSARAQAGPPPERLQLFINAGHAPMVDGTLVYSRGFGEAPTGDPSASLTITPNVFLRDGRGPIASRHYPLLDPDRIPEEGCPHDAGIDPSGPGLHFIHRRFWASFFPRRVIVAESDSTIKLRITNRLAGPHTFTIRDKLRPGTTVVHETFGPAGSPTATKDVDFLAPAPGTYIYEDVTDEPVNRVLGLHGVLVVVPADRPWTFSADGEGEFERQWVWLLHDIDPEWARRAQMGVRIDPVATPSLPRYFTLNGRSGVFSVAHSPDRAENRRTLEDTKPCGHGRRVDVRRFSDPDVGTGQLIRLVNTGVAMHQPHFHGNHVWTFAHDNEVLSRSAVTLRDGHLRIQHWEDVVEIDPLSTKALMLPIKVPPEALDEVVADQQCEWVYPMHCHAEMSQTAGGGLYPGGQVSDWILKP